MGVKEQQSSISKFFKPTQSSSSPAGSASRKRPSSPIDLTNDDEDVAETATTQTPSGSLTRPSKKQRQSLGHNATTTAPPTTSAGQRVTQPRVADVSLSAPMITVEAHAASKRVIRVGEARRKWALSSEPEVVPPEDLEAQKARRNAFATKLSTHFERRDQRRETLNTFGMEDSPTLTNDDEDDQDGMDIDEVEPKPSKARKGKGKPEAVGPSGKTWTPLEKQILDLKERYPGILLLVEVGYKFKFYGEDARIASKALGIACFPSRNFLTASIPVHRRPVHVKKLISQGHKVGIIGQAETAALKKVSDNRSGPFTRKLTDLYTAATYVDDMNSVDDVGSSSPSSSNSLICVVEQLGGGMGSDERVTIGLVSITPSTGDLVYDEFVDTHMRTELETRMTHLRPCEMLLPAKGLSKVTEKMLRHFTDIPGPQKEEVRVEEFAKQLGYSDAFEYLTEFYAKRSSSSTSGSDPAMAIIAGLPKTVVVALAHILKHLEAFELTDTLVEASMFAQFTSRTHMLLNGNTLSNLEIYENQTDYTQKGSLLWILDKTKTRFGARLLRSWIGKPLIDKTALQERVDAVDEVLNTHSHTLDKLRIIIKQLPDLVKGLARIQYGRSSPKELSVILEAYERIGTMFQPFASTDEMGLTSPLLREIVFSMPRIHEPIQELLAIINVRKASLGEKSELWRDEEQYPAIPRAKEGIVRIENELQDELKSMRKLLKRPSLQYVSVGVEEYMVEVPGASIKEVPKDWIRVSSTKKVTRFHSPNVKRLMAQRARFQETLIAESDKAYLDFLGEVSTHYALLRDVTNKLAIFGTRITSFKYCINSLALVANEVGYAKPEFVDDDVVDIVRGRHPMVEALRSDPFVPNDISLGGSHPRHEIITGPNMGGKSSFVRMTALIIIMAQIGSYVPAKSARLGMHDAVLTRMGAYDELARGRSTFMVEISETSDILKTCTPRSLVILDELGRGTSTFDGMAIAHAVMQHLVEAVECKTLFITHYPLVATEIARQFPDVQNGHMGYVENERQDGTTSISFLYRLEPGLARSSFGIECARLAGLPENLLAAARVRSSAMEKLIDGRRSMHKYRQVLAVIAELSNNSPTSNMLSSLKNLQ